MFDTARTLLDLVGRTPVLRLEAFESTCLRIYAKLEGWNPTGSVKDRAALALIDAAERQGRLRPGMTVVEATSGNTGIGLAMVCRLRGHPLIIVMSRKASRERVAMLRSYGVELVLTSRLGGADEARQVADDLAASDPARYCRVSQHRSREIVVMHHDATGSEILEQVPGPISYVVIGLGTSATLLGVARRLREVYPRLQVVGVQPTESFNHQEGLRNFDKTEPPEIFDRRALDRIVDVSDDDARKAVRELMLRTGLFCGTSSGSCVSAVQRLAGEGARGTLVTLFPDRGEKYLSTGLYDADEPTVEVEARGG
jgi:cysteine synthase